MVTKVQVKVLDEEGRCWKREKRIRTKDNWWEFALRHTEGKTSVEKAEAWDLPGHVTWVVA